MTKKEANQKTMSERIQKWWPKGVEATNESMRIVIASKEAAIAADLKKRVDMTAMRSMFDFYEWAEANELPIAITTATSENVDEFIETAYPDRTPSSQAKVRWSLDCLAGRKTFIESKKVTATNTPGELLPQKRNRLRNFAPASDVIAEIESWQPKQSLDVSRWDPVAQQVRQLVTLSNPLTLREAELRMDIVSLLAAWADHHELPLRHDLLLSPSTINRFLKQSGYSSRSKKVHRSTLKVTARCVTDQKFAQARRNKKPEQPLTHPYSPAELATIRDDCGRAQSQKRRRHLTAVLDLCVGAGLGGGLEAACVTPDDIRTENGFVVVKVWKQPVELREGATPLTRPIRLSYTKNLLELADEAKQAGDQYLIGGNNIPERRNRRPSELCNDTYDWTVSLRTERARLTWLVHVLDQPVNLLSVLDHLDLVSIQSFEAVVPFLTSKPTKATWPLLVQ